MLRVTLLAAVAAAIMLSSTMAMSHSSDDYWRDRLCPPPPALERLAKRHEAVARLLQHWRKWCERDFSTPTVKPAPTARPTEKPTPTPFDPKDVPTRTPETTVVATATIAAATASPTPTPTPTPSPTPTPTPSPTPSPTPVPGPQADISMTGLTVTAPPTGTLGVGFQVRAGATMRNTGPAASILADLTFTFTAPGDCTVTPSAQVVVQDTNLPLNVNVFVSRSWTAMCSAAGPHVFNLTASAVPDPVQGGMDPNPADNGATSSGTTQVN